MRTSRPPWIPTAKPIAANSSDTAAARGVAQRASSRHSAAADSRRATTRWRPRRQTPRYDITTGSSTRFVSTITATPTLAATPRSWITSMSISIMVRKPTASETSAAMPAM